MERRLENNIKTIYGLTFFQSAMIITAVFVPLLQRHGLSMSEILLTQSLFAMVITATEVPSGYIADLYGRKNAIITGSIICFVAFIWLAVANSFIDFLIYEGLMGLGMSLFSGADLALLYDSQSAINREKPETAVAQGKHIARLVAIEGYAGATAALLASLLTLYSLDWVLWAQCVISLAALLCSLFLVEAPRELSAGSHTENFKQVIKALVLKPLVLWTAAAIVLFNVAALNGFWLLQKYWELQGVPITWFGYIWALHCIIRGVTAHQAHYIENRYGWQRIFIVSALLPVIGFIGMGVTGGVIGIIFGLTLPICRGLNVVVFYDALNKRVEAGFRATVNSVVSLATRGLFIVSGPALGFMADTQGVHFAYIGLGVLFLPTIACVLLPLARHIQKDRIEFEQPAITKS